MYSTKTYSELVSSAYEEPDTRSVELPFAENKVAQLELDVKRLEQRMGAGHSPAQQETTLLLDLQQSSAVVQEGIEQWFAKHAKACDAARIRYQQLRHQRSTLLAVLEAFQDEDREASSGVTQAAAARLRGIDKDLQAEEQVMTNRFNTILAFKDAAAAMQQRATQYHAALAP
jgi:hypothetical protein